VCHFWDDWKYFLGISYVRSLFSIILLGPLVNYKTALVKYQGKTRSLPEKFAPSTFQGLQYRRETSTRRALSVSSSPTGARNTLAGAVHRYMYFGERVNT
jgi:hypothetical protein